MNGDAATYKISVVLPTYNRLARLKQVLAGLERQTYPLADFEVVVVSDGSSDGTHEFLEGMDTPINLNVVVQSNQGVSMARNCGVDEAKGEIILFIDDDVVPKEALVAEHMRLHEAYGGDLVVLGTVLPPPDFPLSPWSQWEQVKLLEMYEALSSGAVEISARHYFSGNSSMPRKLFLACGGFDPEFRRAEDLEFGYRLGGCDGVRFMFNEEAAGYHYSERSFASWINIPYVYGRNFVLFATRKGQGWLLPTLLRESRDRHPFVRALVWMCLDRPLLSKMSLGALKTIARLAPPLSNMAYSGIFNLLNYQGMADEMNGRSAFYRAVAEAMHSNG